MEMRSLELQITSIPEWDAEDEMVGVLADETPVKANEAESKEMLNSIRLQLPRVEDILQVKLLRYAEQRKTPLKLAIPPDSKNYDFYLMELPLNIMMINQRLARLRLRLDLEALGQRSEQVVAYDLFPNDTSDTRTIMSGEVQLDVSKALKYILTASGAGAAATPLAECFGLKLDLPFKWTSTYATVQTSDRMSNPVEWYVTDDSIQNGFTGHVIIRAPKHSTVNVAARLTCEVRRGGVFGRIRKAQYKSDSYTYSLKG